MNHAEFKKRFLPLQKMLYREAYKVLCDRFEAEDAVQNLYVKLWERRDELSSLVSPEAYCRTVLRNICIDRWRLIRAHDCEVELSAEEPSCYTPPEIEGNEVRECLEHFLAGLPDQQRRVMKMSMNGCGIEEIEFFTGLSQTNIRVILSRLRRKFREYYNKL